MACAVGLLAAVLGAQPTASPVFPWLFLAQAARKGAPAAAEEHGLWAADGEQGLGVFVAEALLCLPLGQRRIVVFLSILQFVTLSAHCSTSEGSSFLISALSIPLHSPEPWT